MKKFIKAFYSNDHSKESTKKANNLANQLAKDAKDFGIQVGKVENDDKDDELAIVIYVQGSTYKYCDGVKSELINEFKRKGFKMEKVWVQKGETLS